MCVLKKKSESSEQGVKNVLKDVHTDLDYKENICRTWTSGRLEVRLKYVTSAVNGAFW